MTQWQEFPLRPQGQPWPGINTRSGKLDNGIGQMTDESVNCIINTADQLAKRKGLIRGIDERFAGAVCGLHRYTDECGREWLIVADEGGFSIRQPFTIPSFANSDAYPSDSFASDGPVNQTWWQNVGGYEQAGGGLVLKSGETDPGDLVWFKDASNFSYQAEAGWTTDTDSTAVVVIKAGAIARLEARLVNVSGSLVASLVWVDSTGDETILGVAGFDTEDTSGILEISYERNAAFGRFVPRLVLQATGKDAITLEDLTSINAVDDADFGQGTRLRLESTTGASSSSFTEIQGGPL